MTIQLCLNTSTIKPQPTLEKIRLAAEAGFDAIELWVNDVYDHIARGGEVKEIELALADTGLRVPCMIAMKGWGDASEPEYPGMLEEAKRSMGLAARLGSPFIVATPPRRPCEPAQITRRYQDLLRLGREIGVRPTFEYLSFSECTSQVAQAWQVVEDANDDDATLVLDAFHTWNGGSTLDEVRAVPLERISHYHIDDAHPDKPALTQLDPDRVMVGDGPIDLVAEIALLHEKGYDGAVSLELFNAELWASDPAEVLRVGIERMRELLG